MCIEKAYGQLKRRFPKLHHGLAFRKLQDSANCIVAAVCIHNFLKTQNDDWEEDQDHDEQTNDTQALEFAEDQTLSGTVKRIIIMNSL